MRFCKFSIKNYLPPISIKWHTHDEAARRRSQSWKPFLALRFHFGNVLQNRLWIISSYFMQDLRLVLIFPRVLIFINDFSNFLQKRNNYSFEINYLNIIKHNNNKWHYWQGDRWCECFGYFQTRASILKWWIKTVFKSVNCALKYISSSQQPEKSIS